MCLKVFKNTVLFFVFVLISCGNKTTDTVINSKNPSEDPIKTSTLSNASVTKVKYCIVGANRTELYLNVLQGKQVGILANQTSVIFKDSYFKSLNNLKTLNTDNASIKLYTHLIDSLLKLNINIKNVFAPEHGFRGTADAGELVKDGKDIKTGLSIFSLHGKHKKPTAAQLKDIDIMVFDIQDVGVRFYTYISTLHYVMEACAEQNIPLLVLDRPNPNGNYIDGPVLEEAHRSFLGMHTIPLVHGMTIGEYAQMINGEQWLKNNLSCDLKIITVENYTHNSTYNLPIRPSPNLPNAQSILLYPSLGLFEGTTINAGRGTEFQFQRYGAPFLDQNHYAFSYKPIANFGAKYPKHLNEICFGNDLSNIKTKRSFTLKYILDAYTHATDKNKFFNTASFTLHAGTKKLQQQIEAGLTETEIRTTWQKDIENYKKMREAYLLYN